MKERERGGGRGRLKTRRGESESTPFSFWLQATDSAPPAGLHCLYSKSIQILMELQSPELTLGRKCCLLWTWLVKYRPSCYYYGRACLPCCRGHGCFFPSVQPERTCCMLEGALVVFLLAPAFFWGGRAGPFPYSCVTTVIRRRVVSVSRAAAKTWFYIYSQSLFIRISL